MKKLLVLPLVLALVACSDDSKKKPKLADEIPTVLELSVPASDPLTEEQETEFAKFMKGVDQYNIYDLVIRRHDETQEQLQTRMSKREKAPKAVKDVLAKIEKNCQIQHEKSDVSTSGQGQGATRTQSIISSIGGANCPIEGDSNSSNLLSVEEFSEAEQAGLITIDATGGVKLDEATSRLLGFKSRSMNWRIKGPFSMERKSGLMTIYVKGGGPIEVQLASGEIVTMDAEIQMRGKGQESQMLIHLRTSRNGVNYVVTVYATSKDGKRESRLFLNTKELPAGSLGDSFTPAPGV